jgi:hypothetical protein
MRFVGLDNDAVDKCISS